MTENNSRENSTRRQVFEKIGIEFDEIRYKFQGIGTTNIAKDFIKCLREFEKNSTFESSSNFNLH